MSDISTWSDTAASNNTAAPDGFPENMAPSGVNDAARELMAATRRQWEDAQWFDFGDTPTYVSGTSFTVVGDLTARYEVGRKIRLIGTTPFTSYATISSATYSSPDTTVVFTVDSGDSVDNTLSAVAPSIITRDNNGLPSSISSTTFPSKAVSADRDMDNTDASKFLRVDSSSGNITLSMPGTFPFGDGDIFYVHNTGSNGNTVLVGESDGAGYDTTLTDGAVACFISNGTELQVLNAPTHEPIQVASNTIHTDNLVFSLDAGDINSYAGTGQTWSNTVVSPADSASQTDYDFALGADTLAGSDDPAFTGTAGASSANEAFEFHQADIMALVASGNTTFLESLHKDNAAFTLEFWFTTPVLFPNNKRFMVFNTTSNTPTTSGTGMQIRLNDGGGSSSYPGFRVYNAGNEVIGIISDTVLAANTTYMWAISVDEAGNGFMYRNGAYDQVSAANTFAATYGSGGYTAPASGTSTVKAQIGDTDTDYALDHYFDLHKIRAYNTNLTKAQLDINWASTKGRFGL